MNVRSVVSRRSFFPTLRASLLAGAAVVFLAASSVSALAQDPTQTPVSSQTQTNGNVTTTTTVTTDANGKPVTSVGSAITFKRGKKKDDQKDDKVVASKDTKKSEADSKKSLRNQHKVESLAGVDAGHPDKQLFDKAIAATNKGHFDVARLDLQTMLNTYPDSEYQMRAKLAIADSWYKEGGTAALTQAESEYADFRVFFPNAPEAAEAQMRIGDIYFRQMDRPDRDYAKTLHAEEEYRRMLTDYPDSTLVPEAKQRLRDVQEVLATRESDIAAYYATRDNYAAVIARYQTVADTYPLYSHMDDVLIGLGDAYEAQAKFVRNNNKMPEEPKARLLQLYDGEAADCYRKVVLEHAAAQHAEDAKERLAMMNLPIPTPTKAQYDASVALENSRSSYKITDYAKLFFMHVPDTVMASHTGEPPLTDVKATTAPQVLKKANNEFMAAFTPPPAGGAPLPAPKADAPASAPAAAVAPTAPAAPLSFQDVPTAASGGNPSGTVMSAPLGNSTTMPAGTGMSVEIINQPKTASDLNNPLKAVRPADQSALPDAEAAAPAPDVPNQVTAATPAAQTPNPDGKKNPKVKTDKKTESGSTDKNKTGIEKIIPHL